MNGPSSQGFTALHFAVSSGRDVSFLKLLLLQGGARVNQASTTGVTPLMLAAAAGAGGLEMLRVLLQHGADPNATYLRGWYAAPFKLMSP